MTLAELVWENPLLVKHLRSRLRLQQLVPAVFAVVIVAACILWWSSVTSRAYEDGVTFYGLLLVQGALLLLVGTSEVASAVANAKDTGTLDFHRISPQPPVATAIGFILGAPIREYVLVAATLPFSLFAACMGPPGPFGWLVTLAVLLASGLLFHTLAALSGVTSNKPRGAGAWVILLILILHCSGTALQSGLLTAVPTVISLMEKRPELNIRDSFLGLKLPYAALSLLHILPVLAFLFIAVVRRMRSERAPVYSKPEAMAFHATIGLLVLGDVAGLVITEIRSFAEMTTMYILTLAALLLTLAVTPSAGEFAKGVRRARKLGLPQVPLWSEWAANWLPVGVFCGLTAVLALVAGVTAMSGEEGVAPVRLFGPLVVAMATIASFGSARQFFGLQFRKAGGTYFALFIFLVWIVPLLVGYVAQESGVKNGGAELILGITPVVGIGMGNTTDKPQDLIGIASAIVASLVLAGIFIPLRLQAERAATEAAKRPWG